MKKLFYLLLLLILAFRAEAQFKIMFVDDSGDTFGNSENLAATLDSLGYDYIYIDAYGNSLGPTADQMSEYDLVIWHTSSWGASLQLWGGGDSTNTELVHYLSQPDANLWLIGLDFVYDRYGPAPVDFPQGDFVFEHLGIARHISQSYADDGNQGVPFVTPADAQPITGLGDINWQFSTLWYADGFELRPEAEPVYHFGGSGYALEGQVTGVWYHPAGGARVLTYGFDLSLASSLDLIKTNFATVLDWWEGQLSAAPEPAGMASSIRVSPNPFSDRLEIRLPGSVARSSGDILISDAAGRLVARVAVQNAVQSGDDLVLYWQAPADLPDGIYHCSLKSGEQVAAVKVVRMRK